MVETHKYAPKNTHVPTSSRGRGKRFSKDEKALVQETFLKSFRNTANFRASCMAANVDRNTVYSWLEQDSTFSFEYKQAEQDANDMLRAEIWRRGVQGYDELIVSGGKVLTDENGEPLKKRIYSDTLLIFLSKARMPEFKEKQEIEHKGSIDTTGARDLLLDKINKLVEQSQANQDGNK